MNKCFINLWTMLYFKNYFKTAFIKPVFSVNEMHYSYAMSYI